MDALSSVKQNMVIYRSITAKRQTNNIRISFAPQYYTIVYLKNGTAASNFVRNAKKRRPRNENANKNALPFVYWRTNIEMIVKNM